MPACSSVATSSSASAIRSAGSPTTADRISPRTTTGRGPLGKDAPGPVTICLGGDVMPGRGLDQILPHPGRGKPRRRCAGLRGPRRAENGLIPRPTGFSWPWGEALPPLAELTPDVRLVNLETSVTSDGELQPGH